MEMIKVTPVLPFLGSDDDVVDAARVSFAKKASEYSDDQNARLINYLAKHNHISPFGHCYAKFHVEAPVFVARQLVKHKFLRWNEISRRYVDTTPKMYTPTSWRGKSEDKKQGSSGEVKLPTGILTKTYQESLKMYSRLLGEGVAPEQARMVLPQGMMTEWVWSGSLDAFANMCNLRCAEDTQYESRIVANKVDKAMRMCYPLSWEALRKYGGNHVPE